MNVKRHIIRGSILLLLLTCSCSKDEDFYYEPDVDQWNDKPSAADSQVCQAIVTSKISPSGEVYFQVTENERVYPANFRDFGYPFDRPRRIVCELVVFDRPYGDLGRYALIDWMEFVQEGPVQGGGQFDAGEVGYSAEEDGLDVLNDWMTSLEDGFLTLHFSAWWGYQPKRHEFLLLTGTNPDDPYEVRLVHHANGDPKSMEADALVAFDLSGRLPVPEYTANTQVTLTWKNTSGEINRRQFPYCGRD